MNKGNAKYIIVGITSIIFFIVIAQLAQTYSKDLQSMVLNTGIFAPIFYIFMGTMSIVVAPFSSSFLLPIAANSFGPLLTVIYSVLSWLIGSVIAFYLARRFGYGELKELKISKKIQDIEDKLSKLQAFILIVFLRMSLPVDILSYALGLFTSISYRVFIWTTFIGILPFAFLFSYASVLPIWYQIGVSAVSVLLFISTIYYFIWYKIDKD